MVKPLPLELKQALSSGHDPLWQAPGLPGRLDARWSWLGGPLSALVLVFCFPVFHWFQLWPLAWIALVPLFLSLSRGGWKNGLFQAVAFGYPFMVGALAWVYWMGLAPWLLLAMTQVAYVAVFTILASLLAPLWAAKTKGWEWPRPWFNHLAAVVIIPSAWILMEWLRTLGVLSIPWSFIGTTQIHLTALVSTAQWWGASGVSFLVAMVNAAIANYILSRGRDRVRAGCVLSVAIVVIVVACAGSCFFSAVVRGRTLKVALIQGCVRKQPLEDPGYRQRVLDTYRLLSLRAARQHASVIVWPETVAPGYFEQDPQLQADIQRLARETHAYLVIGSPNMTADGRRYNSALILTPSGRILGKYSKEHIVPFGEYVPWRNWIPYDRLYEVPKIDLQRGQGHAPISTPRGKWGVMICYESMYPQIAREAALKGAEVLFVITNDEWFGDSSAPYDHAAAAAFRAAETGRWIAQAGSTGISFFADASGAIHQPTTMFQEDVDVHYMPAMTGTTLYTRLGDWPPFIAMAVLFACLGIRVAKPGKLRHASNGVRRPTPN